MNRAYIEANDIIRRYHLNKLSDDELNDFELYILDNPDIIPVIEKEAVIIEAFKAHDAELGPGSGGRESPGLRLAALASLPFPRFATAASALLVTLLGVWFVTHPAREPILLEPSRSVDEPPFEGPGSPVVAFKIDMGPRTDQSLRTELVGPAGNVLFSGSGLSQDDEGYLHFRLRGQEGNLSGDFVVNVYDENILQALPEGESPAPVVSFPVRLTAP